MKRKNQILAGVVVFTTLWLASCLDTSEDVLTEFADLLRQDTIAINNYVKKNNLNPRVDVNGIRFIITQLGTGIPPRVYDEVEVTYEGTFLNGDVFDQGNVNGQVGGFVSGFSTALQFLPVGTSATLIIPSVYAYGPSGNPAGNIPPNAPLIFDMALNKIKRTAGQDPLLASDTTAIRNFLNSKNIIGTIKDPSGMRYTIIKEGEGEFPGLYDRVKIKYTIKLLSTEQLVASGASQKSVTFDSWVVNYMPAVQIMLKKLKPGGSAVMYIPSELGYGPTPFPFIPGNSNLIYELELVEVDPE